MPDSIFTKIIKGDIPSHKVYEDNYTFAFMDIHPIQAGQILVVTKKPAETFIDLPDEDYRALWSTVRKISIQMKRVFPEKKRIGIMVEGLEVPHTHVKIFPINSSDEFRAEPSVSEPDNAKLSAMAEKLKLEGDK